MKYFCNKLNFFVTTVNFSWSVVLFFVESDEMKKKKRLLGASFALEK